MIVSERQQDSPKLSFARSEQSRTNQVVDQKITLTRTLPLLNYLTPSWGFLAISLSWAVENQNGA